MKNIYKKPLCLALLVATLFTFAACGKSNNAPVNVKGVWLAITEDNEEVGYSLDELIDIGEEVESGYVKVYPYEKSYFVAYRYIYTSNTEIQINKYTYDFSDDETKIKEYDTLSIEKEFGEIVLVSTKTGIKYYYDRPVEY